MEETNPLTHKLFAIDKIYMSSKHPKYVTDDFIKSSLNHCQNDVDCDFFADSHEKCDIKSIDAIIYVDNLLMKVRYVYDRILKNTWYLNLSKGEQVHAIYIFAMTCQRPWEEDFEFKILNSTETMVFRKIKYLPDTIEKIGKINIRTTDMRFDL
jgi:hypothetical protein